MDEIKKGDWFVVNYYGQKEVCVLWRNKTHVRWCQPNLGPDYSEIYSIADFNEIVITKMGNGEFRWWWFLLLFWKYSVFPYSKPKGWL